MERAALVLLALGVGMACWVLPGVAGAWLGTEGFWPLDRVVAVFAGLWALEKVLQRRAGRH